MIPLTTAEDFGTGRSLDAHHQPLRFFSLSRDLLSTATREIIKTYREDPVLPGGTYDLLVGHAASERASEAIIKQLRIPHDIYFRTHPEYGNTVAASVPLALSLAQKSGRLTRGQKVLVVVGASGITIALATFTF